MKLSLLMVILFTMILNESLCQTASFPSPLPRSPEAYSFFKYGNIQASGYSGAINLDIPLYTIKYYGFEFPIHLTSGGQSLKVDELSSWVGLNWSLVSNCYVEEVIQGAPDGISYPKNSKPLYDKLVDPSVISAGWPFLVVKPQYPGFINPVLAHMVQEWCTSPYYMPNLSNLTYPELTVGLEEIAEGKLFQPDLFHFNILGNSGSFYKNPFTDKIEIIKGDPAIRINEVLYGWEFTLPNGVIFELKVADYLVKTLSVAGTGEKKTWKLSKIILENKKTIDFIYTDKNYSFKKVNISSSIRHKNNSDLSNDLLNWQTYVVGTRPDPFNIINYPFIEFDDYYNSENYLKEIRFGSNTVYFNLTSDPKPLLDNIIIKDEVNNRQIGSWKFTYGEFNKHLASNWGGSDEQVYKKYKLMELKNLLNNGKYLFEYIENLGLPHVFSKAKDYWGGFNGEPNQTLLVDQRKVTSSPLNYFDNPSIIDDFVSDRYTAIRTFDSSYAIQGMIKKIVYPTGGYSILDFEPNRFTYQGGYIRNKAEYISNTGNSDESIGAGFRIKMMSNYNHDNALISKREFIYEKYSGVLHSPIHFWQYFTRADENNGFHHILWAHSDPYYPNPLNREGIGYSKVKEVTHDVTSGRKHWMVTKYFNNPFTSLGDENFVFASQQDYRNGLILSENLFDNNSACVQSKKHDYELVRDTTFLSIYGDKEMSHEETGHAFYKIFVLPIKTNLWKKSIVRDTLFYATGQIINNTIFNYTTDKFKNLKNEILSTSNTSLKKTYFYPNEIYSSINSEMVLDNFVSIPIKSNWVYEDNPSEEIYVEKLEFQKWHSKFFKLRKVEAKGINNLKDSIINYDEFGNPLEVKKDNSPAVVYVWGYSGQYPIAQIVNASYNEVLGILGQSTIDQLNQPIVNEELLVQSMNLLRNHSLLKKSNITSYTYFPSVGIASKTDEKGLSEYYIYDDSGRLLMIQDNNHNIVKTFRYNFK
ncbi:hypothetical protein [Pedobacter hiemivivus]|uniref:RHS repeat protein n=1 Tax=Pedobacter hiemivivus TaxID=2530454 RepID=A0A4R0NFD7_9SPHI|nr:hypothetical protein [Pedobacter hiemivivus]TCC99190.1 hypothetical protein EZ444_00470 [Pedobacter hiemivivus]